jgi:CubicO group peptidase (beta-lactamase class C family)
MNNRILLVALVLLAGSCEKFDDYNCAADAEYQVTNLVTEEKAAEIAGIICNTLNSNELIGIQVSIRDSINEAWNISIGATDLKQNNKLENEQVMRIGSVSKIYTSTLIMKLIELGYLQLNQKIAEFFPDQENVRDVTIKDLLNHSSGIVDIFSIPSMFISASNFPDKNWDPNNIAEVCMKKKLGFSPGSQNEYSNTNYILLGLIAEKATGRDVGDLFNEYIFEPTGLNNTYLVPYMETPPELVNGYVHHFALSLKEWYTNEPENTSWSTIAYTAGAISSNSRELSAFTYHLFNGDIITNESVELMTEFKGDKGLGLFKIRVNDHYCWGHEGEITGFESLTIYDPEKKIVISICCNTTPSDPFDLLNEIYKVL